MNKYIILFVIASAYFNATAQPDGYSHYVKKADSLYQKKEYLSAARAYSSAALLTNQSNQNDWYNAACGWALSGYKDSAFRYLMVAVEKYNYENYSHIITDTDLDTLHSDSRWQTVLEKVKFNKIKSEEKFIKPVVAILDSVYQEDQKYRKGIVELIQKEGMESPAVKERLLKMHNADSINLIKVKRILDEYGWLGFDKVGRVGALTIFLVIQHSPLDVQQKYLPMMREAVKNKQAIAANLALLEDRVALGEGRKQIYGSQIQTDMVTRKNFVQPLEDPDNVDKRRAQVGLGPIADYLKGFGIEWDVEEFKKHQQESEKKISK